VRSKRWASDRGAGLAAAGATATDAANNAVLVRAMTGVSDRRAKYVCAAAYAGLGREIVERGEAVGDIVDAPRGTQGFGYDPYFLAAELGRTFGEATIEEKAMVSHRARAFRALLAAIMQTA
jgi:XTP/dITP diphosphohydrolase